LSRLSSEVMRPDEIADQRELSEIVDEVLPQIPEDQRVTFILYIYVGLSLPEIAEVMEANLPTTKSRLRLAREKLRVQLSKRGIAEPDGETL